MSAALPAIAGAAEPPPATPCLRGPALLGLLSLGLFAAGFGGWSALAPLSEAAITPGVIRSEGSRRVVQHLEGGIVSEILARDGDLVRAGQPLMRLDDIQAAAALEMLRGARWAQAAQLARLEAEAAGEARIRFPGALREAADPRVREAVQGQETLFTARTIALRSQLQVLEARLSQHAAAAVSARAQRESQQQQLLLLKREEADVEGLLRQGLERLPRLRGLQRQVASAEGNIADYAAQIERAEAQATETERELRRLREQRVQEVGAEQVEVRARLQEIEERIHSADDVAARRAILAPEDGVVIGSRFFNRGAVVRPGDTVLEIVPARDRLVAEVRVAPSDIDTVHEGLRAEIRLPGYKQRLVPYLHGEVVFVGGDVTEASQAAPDHYRARIVIDPDQLAALPGVELRAGMPVEAQIKVGERSLLRYMLQPLLDSFHRAFRET